MSYNFVADSFHTKKLCSRLSSSEVRFYAENGPFVFWAPLWGFRSNIWLSSYAHWKVCSKLRIDVNLTFFARCYRWGAMSKYQFKIGDFTPMGPVDQKFRVEWVANTNHSSCHKTWVNGLSWGIRMQAQLSFVLLHVFDRWTDRILIIRPHLHSMPLLSSDFEFFE